MTAQFPTEQSESGEFQRQEDAFREWIKNDGSTVYPAASDRYHLYVSLACPWASRAIIFRKLKGLEEAIGMTVVDPIRDESGWAFRESNRISIGIAARTQNQPRHLNHATGRIALSAISVSP